MENFVVIALWDSCLPQARQTLATLQNSGISVSVVNSSSEEFSPNAHKCPNIFIEQIKMAVRLTPERHALTYISGDTSTPNWVPFLLWIQDIFSHFHPGVYAPYFTSEGYPREFSALRSELPVEDIDVACLTDGLVVTLDAEIIDQLKEFFDYLEQTQPQFAVGWGIDWIWSLMAIKSGKLIIRDGKYPIHHPTGTSYDSGVAKSEFHIVINAFIEFAETKYEGAAPIRRIIFMINERLKGNPKYLSATSFFPDLANT